MFREANCQKLKSRINETLKNAQKQTIKFDRLYKNARHRFYLQIYYKLKNKERGGQFSVSQLPITSLKYLSISPPPQLFFFIKYRRNRLLRVGFIE